MELYNGDCLEILKTIPDKSVDLIICDLPYGCLNGGGITKKETAEKYGRKGTEGISGCAWDIKIDLPAFWEQVKRIRKNPNSPCLHFCTTKFGFELGASNPAEFRYDLVWDKQRGVSFLSANKMPMRSHEMIYVFSKAGAYYKRKDIEGDFKGWKTDGGFVKPVNGSGGVYSRAMAGGENKRCVLSIVQINGHLSRAKGQHPTQKPVDLYKFLLERYCPAGGTVLDPTFGSGNSGLAAQQLGLKYIGIEKDEAFFKKAKAVLLPEPEPEVEIIQL
jgi:site-specific DNA-methyltransferase (adenine-specific)